MKGGNFIGGGGGGNNAFIQRINSGALGSSSQ